MFNITALASFLGLNDEYYERTQQQRLSWFYKLTHINIILLCLYGGLCALALILLYAAAGGNADPWMNKQAWRMFFALIGIFIIALMDPIFLMRMIWLFFIICLCALIAIEFIGVSAGGAKRWLSLGGFRIQPSEFMKIALVMLLARIYQDIHPRFYHGVGLHILIFAFSLIPILLILRQPDLGTAIALLLSIIIVIFLVGASWNLFILGLLTSLITAPLAWIYVLREYQKQRILTFLNPDKDLLGSGYHILQSKIAIGSGGFFGKGFLQGTQSQLQFLPERHTDFIFALLVEEWGIIGALFLLLLYIGVIIIGIMIALYARTMFHKLTAAGLTAMLAFHGIINIGMVSGVLPVVGIPLPFISYGGTSFLVNSVIIAMLIHISIHQNIELPNYFKK